MKKIISSTRHKCGICGKTKNLTKTECCGNWICNDEDKYVLFSYARNSCMRNHRHFTLCNSHYSDKHEGNWQNCEDCRSSFDNEMYSYYGTNEYNFVKLKNPPKYELIKCSCCASPIDRIVEGYSTLGGKYWCEKCTDKKRKKL